MRRYSFALQAVLQARRAQEAVARADLLRANLASSAAELVEGQSLEHYRDVVSTNGLAFMEHRQRGELAAKTLIDARGSLTDAKVTAETAMTSYLEAARSVSVLEHLDERRRQEHAAAVQREEADMVDELVTSRYARAHKRASAKTVPAQP